MKKTLQVTTLAFACLLTPFTRGQKPPGGRGDTTILGPTYLDLSFGAGQELVSQDTQGTGAVRVREGMGAYPYGTPDSLRVGLPDLSMRYLDVLVPYEARLASLRITVLNEVVTPLGVFPVAPVGIAEEYPDADISTVKQWLPPDVQLDSTGRDPDVYSLTTSYPLQCVEIAGTAELRAAKIARVAFYPYRWNPTTQVLARVEQATVRVQWARRSVPRVRRTRDLGDFGLDSVLSDPTIMANPDVLDTYGASRLFALNDYVIITSKFIKGASKELANFEMWKTSQGHKVATRTVENLQAWYPAASPQESVRKFLRLSYQREGIENVLIISGHKPLDAGDQSSTTNDPLPMFATWPRQSSILPVNPTDDERSEHGRWIVPTDLYFAELSGSDDWDVDNDGFAGERRDDRRSSRYVTDFYQEVQVGRIPTSHPADVDLFLRGILDYEQAPIDVFLSSMRKQVWLAMSEMTFYGATLGCSQANLGDQIAADLNPNCFTLKMYQIGNFDELLTDDSFTDKWTTFAGPGIAVWAGHGNEFRTVLNPNPKNPFSWKKSSGAGNVVEFDQPKGFQTGITRAFVFSNSCKNGSPFLRGSGTPLLKSLIRHAAAGAILNTGNSLGNTLRPKSSIGYESYAEDICHQLVTKLSNGDTLGRCLLLTRRRGDWTGPGNMGGGLRAQNLLSPNVFGDPTSLYRIQ